MGILVRIVGAMAIGGVVGTGSVAASGGEFLPRAVIERAAHDLRPRDGADEPIRKFVRFAFHTKPVEADYSGTLGRYDHRPRYGEPGYRKSNPHHDECQFPPPEMLLPQA